MERGWFKSARMEREEREGGWLEEERDWGDPRRESKKGKEVCKSG